ncbi:MAG: cytochrome-c peroxidase [Acidobacteria bacterium]|nr:cytochrome-c peroxidase [Acidobacteriota bacterium]
MSCASCHNPELAFSDGRPVSIGVFGRTGRRNAPALINRAWGRAFFWDGRAPTLEEPVLKPIEDPNEMDLTAAEAARRVGVSVGDLARALASYVRSILAGDSPYDRFVNGDRATLSPEQQHGLQIFRGKQHSTRWSNPTSAAAMPIPGSIPRSALSVSRTPNGWRSSPSSRRSRATSARAPYAQNRDLLLISSGCYPVSLADGPAAISASGGTTCAS